MDREYIVEETKDPMIAIELKNGNFYWNEELGQNEDENEVIEK